VSRVIAITGASAGIGRATALRLAREGATLALNARRRERLDRLADEIVSAGGTPLTFVGDVAREVDMHAFVAQTVERFGRLDVMICNAGFGVYGTIDTMASEQMHRLLEVNYLGTFYASRAALAVFRRQNAGHLIVVSSIVGKRGVPYMGAYAATKFAQIGMAECIRAELAGSPIHVSVVLPISTDTEFFAVMTRESGHATRAAGPRQKASDVARAIAAAIERPVAEVYPYRMARGLGILNAIAPAVCDRLVKRWGRKPV
jgi:short-subunit dehydrogenase